MWDVKALIENAKRIKEDVGGYTLFFPADDAIITQVYHFVLQERTCCAFLEFTLIIPPDFQDISLAISGSPAAKSFIQQILLRDVKLLETDEVLAK